MSNLKHLSLSELFEAKLECKNLILDLREKIHKIENGHPAFISEAEVFRLSCRINGQRERLKWIDFYFEKRRKELCRE